MSAKKFNRPNGYSESYSLIHAGRFPIKTTIIVYNCRFLDVILLANKDLITERCT